MTAQDIAKYYLAKASADGDLITPLKMQKLVYYAYVWVLVNTGGAKLFSQPIEAWPNGPVVAELYRELKKYGSMPIAEEYIGDLSDVLRALEESESEKIIDQVYEEYMPKTAFELVNMTHNEAPWKEAREGLKPTDICNNPLSDTTILASYSF